MSAVPSSGDATPQAPSTPSKKSLNNETWWKIKFILSQIIPETGRALAPNVLEKPFSSERWTIAPTDIQYRNAQALAKKKTLGVNHRTILKVAMTGLLLIGGAASLYFTIHGLIAFSVLIAVAILLLQLANKLYFLKDPPASRNPHYLEGEKIELVTRVQGGKPADAQDERNRAQHEKQKGAPAMQQHRAPPQTTRQRESKPTSSTPPLAITNSDENIARLNANQLAKYAALLQKKDSRLFIPKPAIYCIPENGVIDLEKIREGKNDKKPQNVGEAILRDMNCDGRGENSDKELFAYPIYLTPDHVALVVVDRKQRTVEYYDSGIDDKKAVSHLTSLANNLSVHDNPQAKDYTFHSKVGHVQQDSKLDGTWVLFFLEQRLAQPDCNFGALTADNSQEMIRKYHQRVLQTLA